MADSHRDAMVISKLPRLDGADTAGDAVVRAFDDSAAALGHGQPVAYLAHHIGDFASPDVSDAFARLKETGRITAFGASVYTPEDVERALAVDGLGVIQLPVSLFNRRMIDSGALAACAKAGITVFARSVFVQGLIFLDPDALPDHLAPARATLRSFRALCADANIAPMVLALAAVLRQDGVHSVVVGADTPDQIGEICAAARATVDPDLIAQAATLSVDAPDTVFDPSQWPQE
jgi:aryl-alcohol dehydrogenase-like predicted oxidoreductase